MAAANHNALLELAKNAPKSFPACPHQQFVEKYHRPEACASKPSRPPVGDSERHAAYQALLKGGVGASLVPDEKTLVCPLSETVTLEHDNVQQDLEASLSPLRRGFDTTWIVENTSSKVVVLARLVNGVEVSAFDPNRAPMDDPLCRLQPGAWISVPTFESYVYHAREIENDAPGRLVLQHRAGMIPLGRHWAKPAPGRIDAEPHNPRALEEHPPQEETGREPTKVRPCNVIDIGFRNEAGFPLSVYWAGTLQEIPESGFTCHEDYHFHMGLKIAPQDFMFDWASKTKYEGAFIGHTFVARKWDDPSVVVDTYTLQPTRIRDCPRVKRRAMVESGLKQEVGVEVQVQEDLTCQNPTNANNEDLLDPFGDTTDLEYLEFAAGLTGTSGHVGLN